MSSVRIREGHKDVTLDVLIRIIRGLFTMKILDISPEVLIELNAQLHSKSKDGGRLISRAS